MHTGDATLTHRLVKRFEVGVDSNGKEFSIRVP